MRFYATIIICIALLLSVCSQRPELTIDELQAHVRFLASDSLKGRKPGTPEDLLAAHYIRENIAVKNGQFLGDDGFQTLEIISSLQLGPNNSAVLHGQELIIETDYVPYAFSANSGADADIVCVGYGFAIHEDSLAWDDYEGMQVAGKWAMILCGDPEPDDLDSPFAAHSDLRDKVFVAKDHGAAGVIFVAGKGFDAEDALPELSMNDGHSAVALPVIHLKRKWADQTLAGHGVSVDSLEVILGAQRRPHSCATGHRLTAVIDVERLKKPTQNVVALLPGSDPVLKDEVIVIGAHYDHLGLGGPGSSSRTPDTLAIHNGADDNASGVATILELFEQLAAAEHKRSILFIAFAAEEMGTLGAEFFIGNPLVPLEAMKFMFNFDMVGRLDSTNALTLYGTGTAVGLEDLLQELVAPYQFELAMSPEGLGPSDHARFYAANIPALMFFTGLHHDYHTPADDAEKLNFVGQKRVTEFAYDVILAAANREEAFVFQEAGPKTKSASRRKLKVTLGIMPDVAAIEKRGMRVDAVTPGRPAANAGMRAGDIIIFIEGKPVQDVYEYMHRLSEFKVGQRISVEVLRGDEKVILIVEL
ncbi:M20/M25/M40 family metallo-hydrolase [candidate division KSB1 bacterium]|nr:M20/M25/M40 family metallo-hydrolase [candidate division KSB1 bacterium]